LRRWMGKRSAGLHQQAGALDFGDADDGADRDGGAVDRRGPPLLPADPDQSDLTGTGLDGGEDDGGLADETTGTDAGLGVGGEGVETAGERAQAGEGDDRHDDERDPRDGDGGAGEAEDGGDERAEREGCQ